MLEIDYNGLAKEIQKVVDKNEYATENEEITIFNVCANVWHNNEIEIKFDYKILEQIFKNNIILVKDLLVFDIANDIWNYILEKEGIYNENKHI